MVNDARMELDAHVPRKALARQLWNKNIVLGMP